MTRYPFNKIIRLSSLFTWLLWGLLYLSGISVSLALSPQAKVSLITVKPGEDLYSGFGHSAFWISDPASGIDRVYNYGTFDFNPDFYVKFVQGKLDYMLSVSDFNYLVEGYREEQRSVIEQVL